MKTIMVIGTGQMGAGIAQVAAQAGYSVILNTVREASVIRGYNVIEKNLGRSVEKGKLTVEDKEAILARITKSTSLQDAASADLIIEAAVEKLESKVEIFSQLDAICPEHTIFSTNTSSLPITEIAACTKRPDRVIGMHFFNPVPVMKLVEVIPARQTSDATVDVVVKLVEKLDKVSVNTKEAPGFIVNRILVPMINEAAMVCQEGLASPEVIDTAMKLGANFPMGPLALADLVGVDVVLAVTEVLYHEFADSKYRPAILLRQMVRAGHLGVKTGKGFYDYAKR